MATDFPAYSQRYDSLGIHLPEVIERIKGINGIKKNKEVADVLGMDQRNLATAKSRGIFPIYHVVRYALTNNIDLAWLLTGQEPENMTEAQIRDAISSMTRLIERMEKLTEPKPQLLGLG